MREEINAGLKVAIKARDTLRTSTLRLINAAIKDRDIAARGEGREKVSDADILALMQKMVKQREESADIYAKAERAELAEQELAEIKVIQAYLPQSMGEDEVVAEIDIAIEEIGAESLRDMGKVVGVLKEKFPGRIDFGKASKVVKAKLGG